VVTGTPVLTVLWYLWLTDVPFNGFLDSILSFYSNLGV
jgi:hypothetical protein